jgi:hypothetical protein
MFVSLLSSQDSLHGGLVSYCVGAGREVEGSNGPALGSLQTHRIGAPGDLLTSTLAPSRARVVRPTQRSPSSTRAYWW